jgi:antitoxin (DNA-binding transcriptional repressor) of toxin-antitoxin stability system
MKNISATSARRHWSNLLGQVQYHGQRFGIARSGQLAAAIIPFRDIEFLGDREDEADLARAREAIAGQEGRRRTTWAELKAYLDLD